MQLPVHGLLDELLDRDLVVDGLATQTPDGRLRKPSREVLERLSALESGSCHGARLGRRRASDLHGSGFRHSCMLKRGRAERGASPMVQTDQTPISTASTAHRSASALRAIGWRTWFLSGSVSLVLVALWRGTPIGWLAPVAATTAILAAVVDWRTLRVPNSITLTGIVATVGVASPLVLSDALGVRHLMLGAALMAGPLLVSHLVTCGRTPGLGDVKLAGVLGLTLGAVSMTNAYVALLTSLLIGAVFGLWYQRRSGRTGFPFAPAIALATIGVLVVAALAERGLV